MSLQRTLTDSAPIILDATCSFKRYWPAHATIRIDIRAECKPDLVMDAGNTNFPNEYFDQIYCDPPHLINKNETSPLKAARLKLGFKSLDPFTRYGWWKSNDEFFQFVEKTNDEFFRILKPDGKLYYKMTEARGCVKHQDLIQRMTKFSLIEDVTQPSKSNRNSNTKTHFLTFIKLENSLQSNIHDKEVHDT